MIHTRAVQGLCELFCPRQSPEKSTGSVFPEASFRPSHAEIQPSFPLSFQENLRQTHGSAP